MEIWGWIAVYAVGLALLQLLLYRYLANGGEGVADSGGRFDEGRFDESRFDDGTDRNVERRDPAVDVQFDPFPVRGDTRASESGSTRMCPHCGAENEVDATFTRCWNCTGLL